MYLYRLHSGWSSGFVGSISECSKRLSLCLSLSFSHSLFLSFKHTHTRLSFPSSQGPFGAQNLHCLFCSLTARALTSSVKDGVGDRSTFHRDSVKISFEPYFNSNRTITNIHYLKSMTRSRSFLLAVCCRCLCWRYQSR